MCAIPAQGELSRCHSLVLKSRVVVDLLHPCERRDARGGTRFGSKSRLHKAILVHTKNQKSNNTDQKRGRKRKQATLSGRPTSSKSKPISRMPVLASIHLRLSNVWGSKPCVCYQTRTPTNTQERVNRIVRASRMVQVVRAHHKRPPMTTTAGAGRSTQAALLVCLVHCTTSEAVTSYVPQQKAAHGIT